MTDTTAWRETTLGALASISRGASPRPIASSRWFDSKSDVRWVRIADVTRSDGRALRATTQALSVDGIARSRFLKPGSLIMSIAATVGIPVITGVPTCIHDGFVALENLKADQRFLLYLLKASESRLREAGQSGSQMNVNTDIVRGLAVRIPEDRKEQRHIAEALWDLDDQIITFERLIAKKQAVKHGMMQQLLTGKTRLSGFSGVWEHRRVIDVGGVLAGKALNVRASGGLRPYLRTKNVLDGVIDIEDVLYMPMTDPEFERFRIEPGDVLLNEGQSLELVGRCSIYSGEFGAPCAMQNQLLRFRAHAETCPRFAAHLFRYSQRTGVFSAISTQTTSVAHIGSSRFSNLRLLWPTDRLEQAAIAEVLSDIDVEIIAYEARLNKALSLKQGMMQQLLTGRTRLPVKESAA